MSVIENFYVRMSAMFGHTFTSQYGTEPSGVAGDTWAAVLAGLSGEQLARGLREVVKLGSDWPPSAPRFRMLCLDIPTLAAVRQEFKNTDSKNRSPFARKMWTLIDSYALSRADQDKADRIFRDAYDLTREHVMNGGALDPAPVAAIEAEKPAVPKPATPEKVKRHLDEIEKILKTPGESMSEEQAVLHAEKVRPKAVTVNQYKDAASLRYIVRVLLDNEQTISLPSFEGLVPPTHQAVQEAIETEIDKLYPQEKTP